MTQPPQDTEVEAALTNLLERYAVHPSAALADLVDLATAPGTALTLSAPTQREQVVAFTSRLHAARPAEVGALLQLVERLFSNFSAANVLELVTVLEAQPPDPRIAALAVRAVSEPGATRELTAPVATALARTFVRHAHPGLAAPFQEAHSRLAGGRPNAHRRFFTDSTAAGLKRRSAPPAEDLEPLRVSLTAWARSRMATSTPADFIQAICTRPDEDAPRAVYADWLLEREDPLGEFITLQLRGQYTRLTKDQASKVKALVTSHRTQWLGALASAVTLSSVRFERGFVAHATLLGQPPPSPLLQLLRSMHCNHSQLATLAARQQTTWVRELTLHAKEGLSEASAVLKPARFTKLHTLTLVSVIEHLNDALTALFALDSLRDVTIMRFERGVLGTPDPAVLATAPVGLERIELVDSGRTWTRGDPLWPDTRAGVA